jgi:small GTP-binding protein
MNAEGIYHCTCLLIASIRKGKASAGISTHCVASDMHDIDEERTNIVNVNVGILGHVDSGKTSLVKALSTLLSTAALDKNPQSQQRGITLDLGFSAFTLPMPDHLKERSGTGHDFLQFTLVDCPGHASLIRTIIGGAQIIDMMILVVDANKGIQTQTAECIVIGEITTDKLIIVLNKCDLLPEAERDLRIEKMTNKLRKIFATTKFANSPIIATSAAVGGEKTASVGLKYAAERSVSRKDGTAISPTNTQGVTELVDLIRANIEIPHRDYAGPLYFAVDHCFAIKGHGTVLTGTVLGGTVSLNSIIEVPHLLIQRKVKSMQMFRKSVRTAGQGDRVGLCVTNLDPASIERSIAVQPGTVPLLSTVICMVKKVRFFRQICKSDTKFHISIGHTTVGATVTFFGAEEIAALVMKEGPGSSHGSSRGPTLLGTKSLNSSLPGSESKNCDNGVISILSENGSSNNNVAAPSVDEVEEVKKKCTITPGGTRQNALNSVYQSGFPKLDYPWAVDFEFQSCLKGTEDIQYGNEPAQWAVLQFQRPVFCPLGSLIIGSKLDTSSSSNEKEGSHASSQAGQCRLAFYGPIKESVPVQDMAKIKVFSWKEKIAEVLKISDTKNGLCTELIGCSLVKEGGSISNFIGMKIETDRGHLGVIMGPYGSSGSFKVKFSDPVPVSRQSKLTLRFKRYLHDKLKVMAQQGLDEYAREKAAAIEAMSPYILDNDEANGVKKSNRQKKAESKALAAAKILSTGVLTSKKDAPGTAPQTILQSVPDSVPQSIPQNGLSKIPSNTAHNVPENVPENVPNNNIEISPPGDVVASSESTQREDTTHPNQIELPISSSITQDSRISIVCSNGTTGSNESTDLSSNSTACPAVEHDLSHTRTGHIESFKVDPVSDSVTAIVVGAFTMEENIRIYTGSAVRIGGIPLGGGATGTLLGPFAKLGKSKVQLPSSFDVSVGMLVEIVLTSPTS